MIDPTQTKDAVIDTVQEALREAGDRVAARAGEVTSSLRDAVEPRSGRRSRWVVLLVALALAAMGVVIVRRRRRTEDLALAPDPFGDAVLEQRQASGHGSLPVSTPGA